MDELSYKEACYAFMITVADEDTNVTITEKYVIDHFFDDHFNFIRLSDKKKKLIGSDFRTHTDKVTFHDKIAAALKKEKKEKQMQAFDLVCKFINTNCPKNAAAWSVANKIQSKLGFTMDEFKEYVVWKVKN